MAYSYGPSIAKNGLLMALDAANRKSYPGTGTTWSDLTGNGRAGSLVNGPTFDATNGGSIVLDGSNDIININSSCLGTSAGTLCFWLKSNTANKDIYNTHSNSWNQNTLWAESNLLILRISNGTSGVTDVTINQSLVFDGNFHFVCTQWTTGGERSIWVDARKLASLTGTLQYVASATFEVGYKSWLATRYTGNMYSIFSYNRALSESEVLQNYTATKGRYGLA